MRVRETHSYGQPLVWAVATSIAVVLSIFAPVAKSSSNSSNQGNPKGRIDDPLYRIPVRAKACTIADTVRLRGPVSAAETATVISAWSILVDEIKVNTGDTVRKGQLLVTTDPGHLKNIREFQSAIVRQQQSTAKNLREEIDATRKRQERIVGLVQKGISPPSDLEAIDEKVAQLSNQFVQMTRGLKRQRDQLDVLDRQIAASNFYSPIDGVVTAIIADPRSVVGKIRTSMNTTIAQVDKPGRYTISTSPKDFEVISLRKGQRALVRFADGSTIVGEVDFVSPVPAPKEAENSGNPFAWQVEQAPSKENFAATIVFSKSGEILPRGLSADVKIDVGTNAIERCLPWNSVRVVDGQARVLAFSEAKGWAELPISIGRRGEHFFEVTSELDPDLTIASALW